jgi:hypothetical protein
MTKLMSVKDLQMKISAAEALKASAATKALETAEAEKKALVERLSNPSGLTDDEISEKASIIINRAVENGLNAVQVLRFPNHICTDGGRAINQIEEGWEQTLTGIPKEIHEFWKRRLRPLGYHIRYQVIDYPGGMPGDIGITLSWS